MKFGRIVPRANTHRLMDGVGFSICTS